VLVCNDDATSLLYIQHNCRYARWLQQVYRTCMLLHLKGQVALAHVYSSKKGFGGQI